MRIWLTALLISLAVISVTASSVHGQNVTLKARNIELKAVFDEIKKQTDYFFWYEDNVLDNSTKVTVDVRNASIKEALDACLKNQPLTYSINDKTIVIKAKEKGIVQRVIDFFSAIDINGKVVNENGQTLAGASVKVKGTDKVAVTNAMGEFSFNDVPDNAMVQVTYLGYESAEVKATANMTITLKVITSELEEIQINAGYYTVKDRERTGSISRIDSKTIGQQPVNNSLMALQNRVPGLQIIQQTGVPGGGFTVQIRGRNSISSGTDPLYIIDGVTFPSAKISANSSNSLYNANPLSTINPDDIQSIEVLKDADATAIYGSRGANGVVLITTKRSGKGETKINASIIHGFNEVGHKVELLNTEQYLSMRREALKNDGLSVSTIDYDLNGAWDPNKYTDWQEVIIGGRAMTTNASLNISGGNESGSYLLNGNYFGEGTVFMGDTRYERAGLHTSINIGSPNDRLQVQFTGSYSHIQSNLWRTDPTWQIMLAPNQPEIYDQYGNLNWANNTVTLNPGAAVLNSNNSGTDTFVANISLNYRILPNLFIKTSGGLSRIKREERVSNPLSSFAPIYRPTTNRISDFSDNFNNNALFEPQLNYSVRVNNHKFEALAGMSFQESSSQFRTVRASGFSSDELMDNIASGATFTIQEQKNITYRYVAGFGRINYILKDKYFINLTGRKDGSTRFGPGKQFAYFGAVGAAWIFSEEKIIKNNLPFISFGKLRGSYGLTGNDQITDYQYLQLWNNSAGTYQGNPTLTPTRIANPDFAWETNKKAEIALQLGFLKDKIRFEVAYYRNRSSNQLVGIALPWTAAFTSIQANLPATVQNKGLEFDINVNIIENKKMSWNTGFNISIPKNKLIEYPDLEISSNNEKYTVGQPLSIKKVYNTSLDTSTGLYVFEDYNSDGTLNAKDRVINKFIGQYYYGGLTNSLKVGQWNIDFLISFTKQNGNSYISSIGSPGYFSTSPVSNQPTAVLSRWQQPGDKSKVQMFSTSIPARLSYAEAKNDGGVQITDASFIRLKNISLAYNFPQNWLSVFKIKSGQVVLQGQNLYTLTNYIGLDPETQSMSTLPTLRSWVVGARINF